LARPIDHPAECVNDRGEPKRASTATGNRRRQLRRKWRCETPSSGSLWRIADHGYRRITALVQRADCGGRGEGQTILRPIICWRCGAASLCDDRFQPSVSSPSQSGPNRWMTAVNQLWVADITYIRLQREFVFLAIVLGAFSRQAIGWELGGAWRPSCRWQLWRRPLPAVIHKPVWCITPIVVRSMQARYVQRLEACGAHLKYEPGRPVRGKTASARASSRRSSEKNRCPPLCQLRRIAAAWEEFIEQIYTKSGLHSASTIIAGGVRRSQKSEVSGHSGLSFKA